MPWQYTCWVIFSNLAQRLAALQWEGSVHGSSLPIHTAGWGTQNGLCIRKPFCMYSTWLHFASERSETSKGSVLNMKLLHCLASCCCHNVGYLLVIQFWLYWTKHVYRDAFGFAVDQKTLRKATCKSISRCSRESQSAWCSIAAGRASDHMAGGQGKWAKSPLALSARTANLLLAWGLPLVLFLSSMSRFGLSNQKNAVYVALILPLYRVSMKYG